MIQSQVYFPGSKERVPRSSEDGDWGGNRPGPSGLGTADLLASGSGCGPTGLPYSMTILISRKNAALALGRNFCSLCPLCFLPTLKGGAEWAANLRWFLPKGFGHHGQKQKRIWKWHSSQSPCGLRAAFLISRIPDRGFCPRILLSLGSNSNPLRLRRSRFRFVL
jgi:hypothetical protein